MSFKIPVTLFYFFLPCIWLTLNAVSKSDSQANKVNQGIKCGRYFPGSVVRHTKKMLYCGKTKGSCRVLHDCTQNKADSSCTLVDYMGNYHNGIVKQATYSGTSSEKWCHLIIK